MSFKYAIALTGSIATGKSSVAKIFNNFGFHIIDADKIAHRLLDKNYQEIENLFGSQYIKNRVVNRKLLGSLIFSNKRAKEMLETLLHPLIYNEIERLSQIEDALKKPYLIDIPLFFETNRYPIEKSLVVYTTKEQQLERLMKRDNSNLKEAKKRVESQISIEKKRLKATFLIDNRKDLKFLQVECAKVKEQILLNF